MRALSNPRVTVPFFFGACAAVLLGIALWSHPHRKFVHKPRITVPSLSTAERRRQTEATIAKYKTKPDPKSQDLVGEAEMRLAYLNADKHDYEASRKLFLQAEKVKGTGVMGADFGGINDQAAYQAAVCLVAEHKESEAKTAFRQFLKEYQMSPLVHAAHKRLERLNGMKSDPADDQLLQSAVTAQEKVVRFEESVCGPKTVEYLLNQHLIQPTQQHPNTQIPQDRSTVSLPDYKQLARLCGTDDKGTSIEGIRDGLKKLGIQSYGLELNRQDFNRLQMPAILLEGDHYFALLERHGQKLVLYDTLMHDKREIKLPPLDDAEFRLSVIAFSMPDLDLEKPESAVLSIPALEKKNPSTSTKSSIPSPSPRHLAANGELK